MILKKKFFVITYQNANVNLTILNYLFVILLCVKKIVGFRIFFYEPLMNKEALVSPLSIKIEIIALVTS